MTKKNIGFKKKPDVSVWVLFSAALLIIVFFLWYFFIYVDNNEKLQIQKNFRVLTQLGENFKSRYDGYSTVIKSTDMKDALNRIKRDDQSEGEFKNYDQKSDYIKKYFFGLEVVKKEASYKKDYIYFGENNALITDTVDFIGATGESHQIINFRINKKDFFQPLERKDVFEELIFIKESPSSKSSTTYNELFFSSFQGDIEVNRLDSLFDKKAGIAFGSIADIKLLGIDYKLFLTHVQLKNNESYYVGGVISKDTYIKDTRSINFYVALLVTIIFFILLLSIPLIKLKVISENQKLKISDLLLSTFSIIIGTFFTLLIIFSFINYSRGKVNVNTELKHLSDSIEYKLTNEIQEIYHTLVLYSDSLIRNDSLLTKSTSYKYFKLIFTLNSNGDQVSITTSRKKPSNPDNYKYRKYFTESGEWRLGSSNLMVDFVYSSSSGEQLGVVSMKEDDSVYVITSRFYSVINTLLPPGYGFCVIDKKGDVKFHSDANRMLRENFLKETENSIELAGAIYGNLNVPFSAKYLGKNHSGYITPISTLPLYLVTFFDNSYSNSINLQITSLTILFLILLLLMFFTTVIAARLIIYRKSELRPSIDIVEWLRPAEWKTDVYRKSIISNLIAIILIVISSFTDTAENTLFIIFLFIPIQIVTVYNYTNFFVRGSSNKKYFKSQFIPSIFFIICVFYIRLSTDTDITLLAVFCVLLILANVFILKYFNIQSLQSNNPKYFYRYLFSWLSLIVIVPVIIFSIVFYNSEVSSDLTHKLFSYANREALRDYEIDKFYSDYVDTSYIKYKNGSKIEGVYYPAGICELKDSSSFLKIKGDDLNGNLAEILFYLKPDLDQLSTERKSLAIKNSEYIKKLSSDSMILKYTANQVHHSVKNSGETLKKTSYYKGIISKFGFGKAEGFILFSLVLLISFYAIFKTIKFTSERIFGITIKKKKIFSDLLKKSIESGTNLVIQCAGMCDKDIDLYFSGHTSPPIDYGKLWLPDILVNQQNKDIILIKNIHPNFEHPEKDIEKFASINKLVENGDSQFVLISNLSIEKLIETIKTKIKFEKDDNSLKPLQKIQTLFESIDKKFVHLYAPINEINKPEINEFLRIKLKEAHISEEARQIITDELIVLGIPENLLKKYADVIIDYTLKEKPHSNNLIDKIVLKVQELATGYYERIWESCTSEEKLLLMDMADNLLLNDKNNKVIERLINKGLFKKNVSVDIINRSFRNFVVEKSRGDYEKEFLETRKSDKWTNYRAPILLVLFAVAFFLALQENILTSVTSILPVVVSIITIVTKISGIFSGSGAKTETAN
jgi:hypothetical protein